ncbi:MAG: amidohydrolase [Lentisphaeria bacterium]|nr:amidohydrolase [Lentisphaeria bacterium]
MSRAFDKAVELRHCLHRIPELAGQEKKTCAAIREVLTAIPGIRVLPPYLQTDTVAFIDGNAPGKNITLRADIDALAVTEATGAAFASEHPGKMHACGHDVHSAILYGAALELSDRRKDFSGSIRLVFQPGEEGLAMAKDLIAAGALTSPAPDFVAALHCEPGLPVGCIGVKNGAMASSCLHFEVTFYGKGGHGSMPHLSRNPLSAAAVALTELQNVVGNRINTQRPAVVSVCRFSGGNADNVIPNDCFFAGTLRALDDETAAELLTIVKDVCSAVATLYKVSCEVKTNGEYPATVNPVSGVKLAQKVAADCGIQIFNLTESAMSSEDFSCFLLSSPDGVFVRLGAGETQPPLHNRKFLPPDEIIRNGIKYTVQLALEYLGN